MASSIGGLAPACSDHPVPELSPRPHRHHPAADRGQLPSRRPGSGSQAPDPGTAVPSAPTCLAQPCINEHPQRTRPPARHHTQVHTCAHIHTCVYRRAHARALPRPPVPAQCARLAGNPHGWNAPQWPRPGPSLVSRPARLTPSANTPTSCPQEAHLPPVSVAPSLPLASEGRARRDGRCFPVAYYSFRIILVKICRSEVRASGPLAPKPHVAPALLTPPRPSEAVTPCPERDAAQARAPWPLPP